MDLRPCRDCGTMIDPSSRGCSTCAMNLDAERMIARFVLWGLVLVAIVAAVFVAFLYLRH
ncbi:MAG TPA: hypothetical protein VMZ30_19485 [Pyrinomonadaceae bacterium]|nr:hypothetical protein [Pyrinomonadaceae bacterium]